MRGGGGAGGSSGRSFGGGGSWGETTARTVGGDVGGDVAVEGLRRPGTAGKAFEKREKPLGLEGTAGWAMF